MNFATVLTRESAKPSNIGLSALPSEMFGEIVGVLPTLSDVVHFQTTSRHLYALSQGKNSWKELKNDPPDIKGRRASQASTKTWMEMRLPAFYPSMFIFPRVAAKRTNERPLRKSQDRFWGILERHEFNYLTGLLSVQLDVKTRTNGLSVHLTTDTLIDLISRNPKLQYLSVYDSSDNGVGILRILRALAVHCPNLRFVYSESNGSIPDGDVYRLVQNCPKLEEIAFPNCPRKSTISKHLGWTCVSKMDHYDPTSAEAQTSKFPVVRHYQGPENDWAVSGRDIMRRPLDWTGLTPKQLESIVKLDRRVDAAETIVASYSSSSDSEATHSGSESSHSY